MRRDGFTLIEVLIAFSILAIVLGVTFTTITSGLSQEQTATRATVRVLEARSILASLGVEGALSEGLISGQMATGDSWQAMVRTVDEDHDERAGGPLLYSVELVVFDGTRPVLNLTTLRSGL